MREIAQHEYEKLVEKYGEPRLPPADHDDRLCSFIILALGKLGGREPNYHSDLDVMFLYEGSGMTRHARPGRRSQTTTTNQHFFSQLGQRIIKVVTQLGPYGRLYELDPRLRPTGKSGALAVSLEELARYFESGQGQFWERQALCKARVIHGTPTAAQRTMEVVRRCLIEPAWTPEFAERIRNMRRRLEETAAAGNLKRGAGGTVDIEFIVQMLQLKNAATHPDVVTPGTLDAIAALRGHGLLPDDEADYMSRAYRFLRRVESGLRLMNTTARHELPPDEAGLKKLEYLLGYSGPRSLREECHEFLHENRRRFERHFETAGEAAVPLTLN